MSQKLGQLLSYLRREDVIQLQFRSGRPVMLYTTRRAHPVTVAPLTSAQIRRFFDGTEVDLDPQHDGTTCRPYALLGKSHQVEIERSASGLTISVRTDDTPPTESPAQTTTRDDLRRAPSANVPPRPETPAPRPAPAPAPRVSRPTLPRVAPPAPGPRPRRPPPRAVPARAANPSDRIVDRLHDALRSARDLGADEVRLSPGRPIQLRVASTWSETGATMVPDEVVGAVRTCLELRHLEQLASRGHVVRAHDLGSTGRWKIHVHRQHDGLAAQLRPIVAEVPPPEAAGVPAALLPLLGRRTGLVLLCGPPGSGKSTTLASLVQWINTQRTVRIARVDACAELPLRPEQALLTQREVWPPKRGWPEAVRHAVRHDPDVLTLDPVSDPRIAAAALRAASTMLTLVTVDAPDHFDGVLRLQALAHAGGAPDPGESLAAHLVAALQMTGDASGSPLLTASEAVLESLRSARGASGLRRAAQEASA